MKFPIRTIFFLAILLSFPSLGKAQIYYSNHFTKKLTQTHGTFIKPIEGYYKVKIPDKDAFINYDLVLHSEEHDFEISMILEPTYHRNTPHIEHFVLASSLAINEEIFDIKMNFLSDAEAHSDFHADWAAYSDFIPKRSVSDKHFARLLTIYHEKWGLMHTLMLFNMHNGEKDHRLYTLRFLPPSN